MTKDLCFFKLNFYNNMDKFNMGIFGKYVEIYEIVLMNFIFFIFFEKLKIVKKTKKHASVDINRQW